MWVGIYEWCGEDMANSKNLKPPSTREARERGRKGGKASAAAKARKRTFREVFEAVLEMDIDRTISGQSDKIADKFGGKITVHEAIAMAIASKAIDGNLDAAEMIRDTIGEKPADSINLNNNMSLEGKLKRIVGDKF